MASTTYHTIAIRGGRVRDEALAKASSNIKPGMLIEYDGGVLDKHGVAGGWARPVLVALESPTAAAGTTPAIDTTYEDGDTVYYAVGQPGDVYYMLAAHSTGNNYVKGTTQLVSAGNGLVKAATIGTTSLEGGFIGVPDESVDNSSLAGSTIRLRVKIG